MASISSQTSSFGQYDERKTTRLYQNIKKSLQEVQEIAAEVNSNYKELENNMNRAAQLITAIKTGKTRETDAGVATASVVTTD